MKEIIHCHSNNKRRLAPLFSFSTIHKKEFFKCRQHNKSTNLKKICLSVKSPKLQFEAFIRSLIRNQASTSLSNAELKDNVCLLEF
jgi:hypothetical protein